MARRPIRVLILSINYAPEPTGIGPYTTGMAEGLAKRGHEVVVMTGFPHYPGWHHTALDGAVAEDEQGAEGASMSGARVRRFKHPIPTRTSWTRRAVMEIAFGLQLVTRSWGRPDVVIAVTPPLLSTALAGLRVRLTPRRPAFGIVVQDLYSRGVKETREVPKFLSWLVRLGESLTLRIADGISVIHAGFKVDLIDELRVSPQRVLEIRNWTHVARPELSASATFRASRGWATDEVVILHAGNMGVKQGLENVVNAAAIANRLGSKARFVLLGDGNQRAALEKISCDLPNVEFLPLVDDEDFPSVLGAADVLLVNERPGVGRMSVPSKLTSYFKAGKPIVAATDPAGFTASELSASGAGVCVPADRPDLLLAEALRLGTDTGLAKGLGDAGRSYCELLLSETTAIDRYERWITDLADQRREGRRLNLRHRQDEP